MMRTIRYFFLVLNFLFVLPLLQLFFSLHIIQGEPHDLQRQLIDMGEKVRTLIEARNEDKNVISSLQKQVRGYESQVRKLRSEVDQLRKDLEQK